MAKYARSAGKEVKSAMHRRKKGTLKLAWDKTVATVEITP